VFIDVHVIPSAFIAAVIGSEKNTLKPVRAAPDKPVKPSSRGNAVPDLARLNDRHAEDCVRTAEKVDNPNHRAMLLKAAAEWRQAAQARRQSIHHSQEQPPSQKLQAPASHTKTPGSGG
jgi:hypothetical protein